MSTARATTVRLPEHLRERVDARARQERRSFSNTLRVLLEAGLQAPPGIALADVDPDEVERLADLAREVLHGNRVGG